ncbi:MAG: DUF6364 family protein [Sphingobacteriaceae bacterium]|jgi:hypothetical protein|nr:MAG: antitoxin [Pedobacter sp.]
MASSKLTLSIDSNVIHRAKQYAEKQHISLSRLVQNYLDQLIKRNVDVENDIDPDILALTGILKGKIPNDIDLKDERFKYLKGKHGI